MAPPLPTLASAGVLAADLLAEACAPPPAGDVRLETVRDLALDLRGRLLSFPPPSGGEPEHLDRLVEAALACADLATLAACNVASLPEDGRPLAAAAAHLAAGTTRALTVLVEAEVGVPDVPQEGVYEANALRDARSAGWKSDLVLRQLGGEG